MTDYKISVSVTHESIPPQLDVVQGDSGRNLVVTIADLNTVGATARVYVLKPSKEEVYNSAKIIDGNIVINLTRQMLAEIGQTKLQISVYKGITPERVSSFLIYLNVQEALQDNGRITSSSEYAALDEAISRAEAAVEKINTLKYAASDTVGGNAKVANKTKAGLSIKLNGTSQGVFDGSTAKSIDCISTTNGRSEGTLVLNGEVTKTTVIPGVDHNLIYNSNGGIKFSEVNNTGSIIPFLKFKNTYLQNDLMMLGVVGGDFGFYGAKTGQSGAKSKAFLNLTTGVWTCDRMKTPRIDSDLFNGKVLQILPSGEESSFIGKIWFYSNKITSRETSLSLSSGGQNFSVYTNGNTLNVKSFDGNSFSPVNASDFNKSSALRFKENIEQMSVDEAEKLYQLNPVTFDYKQGKKDTVGFIAEEVEKLYPTVCAYQTNERGERELFGLDYSMFAPYLVKAVQEQKKEIDELKTEIEELKKMIKNK